MAADDAPTINPAQAGGGVGLDTGAVTLAPPAAGPEEGGFTASPEAAHGGRVISHYRLGRQLGAGAVGEVFLAHDNALDRPVALKLLRPGLPVAWRRMLIDEAAAAIRLQHPAIATFYESGEADGVGFIASEFVPGQSLRDRLRSGPLPLEEALNIAEGLLAALAHAHAVGMIHRDVKPENLVLSGTGGVRLLDFGLAARLEFVGGFRDSREAVDLPLPAAGMVAGTPGYMPPEQIRGEAPDARADLFAAAAVLYELLSGVPAFGGPTPEARWQATLRHEPAPLTGTAFAHLPPALWPLLRRTLAKHPEDRPSSAGALLAELRRAVRPDSSPPAPSSPPEELIAICQWHNFSGHAEDAWIGQAVAESLACGLGAGRRVKLLSSAAAQSALEGAGSAPASGVAGAGEAGEAAEAGRLGLIMGCRHILTGGFQRLGQRIRLTARLVEAPTGHIVLAQKVDGAVDDLFDLQDRLVGQITSALPGRSPPAGEGGGRAPAQAPSPSVYECYARGRVLRDRMGKGDFEQAQLLYEQAIAKDPEYAPALAELAAIHGMAFIFTVDRSRLLAAGDYARRAIAVDPRSAAAYVWLGYSQWRLGEAGFTAERRAAELDPHDFMAPYFAGCISASELRWPEAVSLLQRSVRLKPDYNWAWGSLSLAHANVGNIDEALWCARRASAPDSRNPYPVAPALMAELRRRQGRPHEGRQLALQAVAAVEATDHAYREGFRAMSLTVLGRCALDEEDRAAAHVAFAQAVAQLKARPRILGGGHLLVQALTGLSRADRDAACLEQARQLAAAGEAQQTGGALDFSWAFIAAWDVTRADLAAAERDLD